MDAEDFFSQPRETSKIKAKIVEKYFLAWATIMASKAGREIAYIDLFSGPGHYADGTKSTPLLVLDVAASNKAIGEKLIAVFNDKDVAVSQKLRMAIDNSGTLSAIKHAPVIMSSKVDGEIVEAIDRYRGMPKLVFLDPFGYAGLTLGLIRKSVSDWGSECVFFFGYNSINRSVQIDSVEHHMAALFGEERMRTMRRDMVGMSSNVREKYIVSQMKEALKEQGARYIAHFALRNPEADRTISYVFFATKSQLGLKIMKEVMAGLSSSKIDGFASFEFDPKKRGGVQGGLFDPVVELASELAEKFSGRTLSVHDVFAQHDLGNSYVLQNYFVAIRSLEESNLVLIRRIGNRKNPLALKDDDVVEFKKI